MTHAARKRSAQRGESRAESRQLGSAQRGESRAESPQLGQAQRGRAERSRLGLLARAPFDWAEIAGWGVREASFLSLLVPLGVDEERVVLLSVSYGVACLVAALFGGVSILFGLGSGPREDRVGAHGR